MNAGVLGGNTVAYKASLADVVEAILRERAFQVLCYPQSDPRSVSSHVLVMDVELHEAKMDAVKGPNKRSDALREVLQVAACAVACLMENGVAERDYLTEAVRKCKLLNDNPSAGRTEAKNAMLTAEEFIAGERLKEFILGGYR